VFSYDDVLKIGRWILVLSVPMAALMAWQYLSPPDSFINAATSAYAQQISFAMGKIRPAGTFSFATGAAHFYVLATAFLIYGLVQRRAPYSRWLLAAALTSVLVVQPVSGSRLLVIGCALVLVAAIMFVPLSGRGGLRILVIAAVICAVFAALSLTSFFHEAITVFMMRWNDAGDGNASMTLASRVFSIFLEPLNYLPAAGLFGKGIGLGTNAASALMTGTSQFLLAEGEWSRVVLEAGPLLGFSFLIYRAWLAGGIAVRAAVAAKRQYLLAWLLAWDVCRSLLLEQFSQPTNLGFVILVSGLCLAALPSECSEQTAKQIATGSQSAFRVIRFRRTVKAGG
jgi:hypothetical protein